MIYVISKSACGDYNVRDIQCNANWDCCPYSDYALIPDDLVEGILDTQGYCDIVLNDEGTMVVSFTANEIPEVPIDYPNPAVDYIVAVGTSGGWTYRKCNSGLAECWYRRMEYFDNSNLIHIIELPFEFPYAVNNVLVSIEQPDNYGRISLGSSYLHGAYLQLNFNAETDNSIAEDYTVYVQGRWK